MTVPLELSETLELALVVPVVLWLSDKLLLGESELLGLAVAGLALPEGLFEMLELAELLLEGHEEPGTHVPDMT